MIRLTNFSYHIGGRTLYQNASFQIGSKDKIGLVGLNGMGKSTLFQLIIGNLKIDSGVIQKDKESTIGYLDQDHLSYNHETPILNIALQAFPESQLLQKKIDQVVHQISLNYNDDLSNQLIDLQTKFEQMGGYKQEIKAKKVLTGMGFDPTKLTEPIGRFSGGWRMRVMLAKLLLESPSLLLLDEPTNHLDISSIQWLENYLSNYPHALLLISHDHFFLDKTTHKTVEVSQQKLTSYAGNYSFYEKEKSRQATIQQRAYQNQQKDLAQKKRFIERFRSKSSKAKQVQSTIKSINKVDKIIPPEEKKSPLSINFHLATQPGEKIVEIQQLGYGYQTKTPLFQGAQSIITRGQKIALIGPNGQGKSTLINLITKKIKPQEGQILLGHNVQFATYEQHQLETLSPKATLLEELAGSSQACSEGYLRKVLAAFLFPKDEVYKKISVLSGGEKARVALAKLLVKGANFLLLDEPTNHLDMPTIEILIHALKKFPGTLLFVSHNRKFICEVADTIWSLKEGKIKSYPGDYKAYKFAQKNNFF